MRGREDFRAMHRQQGLVGRDHVLAGLDRFQDQLPGHAVAADQLDHDVDLGVGDHRARVAHDLDAVAHDRAGSCRIEIRHHGDLDAAAGTAADLFLIALEDVEHAAAHGACTEQADLDGFHLE